MMQHPRSRNRLDRARAQTRRYTWIRLDRDPADIAAEHRLILAAAERRDPRSVRVLVEAHLTAGYEIVGRRVTALVRLGGSGPSTPMRHWVIERARGGDALTATV